MAAAWEAVAKTENKDGSKVLVAEINCLKEDDLCKQFNVNGFPPIHAYLRGKFYEDGSLGRSQKEREGSLNRTVLLTAYSHNYYSRYLLYSCSNKESTQDSSRTAN